MKDNLKGELISEFIGTALLCLIGDGIVATATLWSGTYGGQWEVSILWGLTVALLVYIFGGVSGAHFNPAVTIALGAFGGFPKKKIIPYIAAQIVGGFCGAGILHGLIGAKMAEFEAANNIVRSQATGLTTAKFFSCFANTGVSNGIAFLIEIVLTFMLVAIVFSTGEPRNGNMPKGGLGPVIVGFVVALGVGFGGPWTMASMNPARDLGPRIWMAVAGWGSNAFPGPNGYFWVPSLGPIVGGLLAGLVWVYLVKPYLPKNG